MITSGTFWASARGRRLHALRGGRKAAEYWRALGFPNLVLARAVKRRKREERERIAEQQAEVSTHLHTARRFLQSTREQ